VLGFKEKYNAFIKLSGKIIRIGGKYVLIIVIPVLFVVNLGISLILGLLTHGITTLMQYIA